MGIQWSLVLFTTLIAWSAGLFGTQALLAIGGHSKKSQFTAWVVAACLLVAGGIAVFFHLQHWDRIFNGFGHLTSGITQELIAIVVLAVVAVVYLVAYRRSGGEAPVSKGIAIIAVVASAILVVVMAFSYMMPSRPAWNSFLWVCYVIGNACVLGPLTMAVIMAMAKEDMAPIKKIAFAGAIVGAVTAVAYAAFLQMVGGSFVDLGWHFDPTDPTAALSGAGDAVASQALLLWGGAVLLGGILPLVAVFLAQKSDEPKTWMLYGIIGVALAVVGAICMRVVFFALGLSVFMFF